MEVFFVICFVFCGTVILTLMPKDFVSSILGKLLSVRLLGILFSSRRYEGTSLMVERPFELATYGDFRSNNTAFEGLSLLFFFLVLRVDFSFSLSSLIGDTSKGFFFSHELSRS